MATEQEIEAAALQFVRKVSGFRKPSMKNADVFDAAVREITAASQRLMAAITTGPSDARPLPAQHSHGARVAPDTQRASRE
jgi:hypothetical protein